MSALGSGGSSRRWRRIRAAVLERDALACQHPGHLEARPGSWAALHAPATWPRTHAGRALVCGAYADHADHVTPRKLGGSDALDNLRAACPAHNLAKGAKLDDTTTTTTTPTPAAPPARWDW